MSKEKGKQLSLVVFIDALGWEVLKNRSFLEDELVHRQKLKSVFGFSSACIPSILTGLMPKEHKHWSFFYYSPKTSPFKSLRPLGWLPKFIVNRGRVRSIISKLVKKLYGFQGYFQLYNIPFNHVHLFDYCEKKDLFSRGGMNAGKNIFEYLDNKKRNYHCSDWRASEETNLASLNQDILEKQIEFGFLYMADMDGLLHQVGKESAAVDEKLAWYECQLRTTLANARENYEDVRLFICSDHGMATVHTQLDLMRRIESLGLAFGKDYTATYDSTLGRFWFHNPQAKVLITQMLEGIDQGQILSDAELARLGCDFEHDQYGELIFLANPGVLILPSHMGETPIVGMHGYHPDDKDSDASLLSNVKTPVEMSCITDVFHLMRAEARV